MKHKCATTALSRATRSITSNCRHQVQLYLLCVCTYMYIYLYIYIYLYVYMHDTPNAIGCNDPQKLAHYFITHVTRTQTWFWRISDSHLKITICLNGQTIIQLARAKKSQKSVKLSFDIVSLATLWLLRNSTSHHKANASLDRQAIIQLAHASVNVFSLHHFRAFFFCLFFPPGLTIILLARAPVHDPTLLCAFFFQWYFGLIFFIHSFLWGHCSTCSNARRFILAPSLPRNFFFPLHFFLQFFL